MGALFAHQKWKMMGFAGDFWGKIFWNFGGGGCAKVVLVAQCCVGDELCARIGGFGVEGLAILRRAVPLFGISYD